MSRLLIDIHTGKYLVENMKRPFQQSLFTFLLIAGMFCDMGGNIANGCTVESSSNCCCCSIEDESKGSCCCGDSVMTVTCTCGCSTPQVPGIPPNSQTDDHRIDFQRSVVIRVGILTDESGLHAGNAEELPLSTLLCATRRRAILCCWIT